LDPVQTNAAYVYLNKVAWGFLFWGNLTKSLGWGLNSRGLAGKVLGEKRTFYGKNTRSQCAFKADKSR